MQESRAKATRKLCQLQELFSGELEGISRGRRHPRPRNQPQRAVHRAESRSAWHKLLLGMR